MDNLSKKIWILDDDKSIRWVLQKALEKNNFLLQLFQILTKLSIILIMTCLI
jgi:DNA-binding NtrC family response regulator